MILKVLTNLALAGNLLGFYDHIKSQLATLALRVKPGDQTIIDVDELENNALLIKGQSNTRWQVVGVVVKRKQ